jgi:glycosyltransferase involved in cell wall biosynthesis
MHQSMPRFAYMLADGMRARGHNVEIWAPKARLVRLSTGRVLAKWLGYIDQYVVFPVEFRRQLKRRPADTLFVFTDQALGPWVPLASSRPHVIHCHDFLAQYSALGKIPENPTSYTGRQYQTFIRRGYSKGQHFISVSEKTREDLHYFLTIPPASSEVVYNGLNQAFVPLNAHVARASINDAIGVDVTTGYILHTGGNQWYKNRIGVIELYNAWRASSQAYLPLLLVGESPSQELVKLRALSPYKANIHFLSDIQDPQLRLLYTGASVFLFPSLAEGFGWPIAEAMASGCPVITTEEAPMTEVTGKAGFHIPRRPNDTADIRNWVSQAARVIDKVIYLTPEERKIVIDAGLLNATRFNPATALNRIESIYQNIIGIADNK